MGAVFCCVACEVMSKMDFRPYCELECCAAEGSFNALTFERANEKSANAFNVDCVAVLLFVTLFAKRNSDSSATSLINGP